MTKTLLLIGMTLMTVQFSAFAESMFRSNELGMALQEISSYRSDEYVYVLIFEEKEEKTTKTLLRQGEEIKKWEILREDDDRKRERYFENRKLVRETRYIAGRIESEDIYTEEGDKEIHRYRYKRNALMGIDVYDESDALLYTFEYIRTKGGRLRHVKKTVAEDGAVSSSSYIFGNRGLSKEWHEREGKGDLFLFDGKGDVIAQERWQGNELLFFEKRAITEEKTSVQKDIQTGITREKMFDEEGRVVQEKAQKNGTLIESITYTYKDGHLVYKRIHTPGFVEEWEYTYDNTDTVHQERYVKNGTLRTVTTYTGENTYVIEYFRKQNVFLRVFFENDVKKKEEVVGLYNG